MQPALLAAAPVGPTAGVLTVTATPLAAVTASVTSTLWGKTGERWSPAGRLIDYSYAGYTDGHGQLDYAFPDPKSGCTVEVTTFFNAQGAGRDVFRARCGVLVLGDVRQCWDAGGCLTFVDDPFALTPACNGVAPCLLGNSASCPGGL